MRQLLISSQKLADKVWSIWPWVLALPLILVSVLGIVTLALGLNLNDYAISNLLVFFCAALFFTGCFVSEFRSERTSLQTLIDRPIFWTAKLIFFVIFIFVPIVMLVFSILNVNQFN